MAYGERQEGDWTSVLVWDCGQTLAAKLRGLTSEDGLGECFLKIIRQSFSEIVPMMDLCIDVRAVV